MTPYRTMKILSALCFGFALPTLSALGYYAVTGDPTFRPLGISQAAIAQFTNSQSELAVVVTIRRGENATLKASIDDVERRFAAALRPYDVPTRIRTNIVGGRDVTITFQVRNTHLGPYSIRDAPSAISAAISAYHLNFDAELDDGGSWSFLN